MNSLVRIILIFTLLFSVQLVETFAQEYTILESDEQHLIIEFNFENQFEVEDFYVNGIKFTKILDSQVSTELVGNPYLPTRNYNIGLRLDKKAKIVILNEQQETLRDKFIIALPDSTTQSIEKLKFNQTIYNRKELYPSKSAQINSNSYFRFIKYASLSIAPFQFNPIERILIFNKKLVIRIDFINDQVKLQNSFPVKDNMTEEFISAYLVNPREALNFIGKSSIERDDPQESYWYNPNKNYYKIYVKEKGVYKVTYNQFVSTNNLIGDQTPTDKLEVFTGGDRIPIDVVDSNSDGLFNSNDYILFVGTPPPASPNCRINIYNLTNLYWFSYQSDSTGIYYKNTNGTGSQFSRSYDSSIEKVHFEKDSIYENLGYSPTDQIDHWFWGKATYQNNQVVNRFEYRFLNDPDFNPNRLDYKLTVNLQGMTNYINCSTDHKAYISLTGQKVGSLEWDGQTNVTFSRSFNAITDTINIYTENLLQVDVRGDLCSSDEIRINWADFEYWKFNRVHGKSFNFTNYDLSGINRYILWQWEGSDMRIFIPQKGKKIIFQNTNQYITFWDTVNTNTSYYIISSDAAKEVDSIQFDLQSDIRNNSNKADYIIITHPKFNSIAEQLGEFRSYNFPDTSIQEPQIKIINVEQIYDEFSYGLLDPFALKNFVKYAFENWSGASPSYVVLIGDMSHDYRQIQQNSRPNFIPSIPYFAFQYGEAASDNMIVAVSGDDIKPDLAIGRISIETVEEGNVLLDKIMNYPADNSKPWKNNILLLASGLSYDDQIEFGFNNASLALRNNYISNKGYKSSFVFNYPDSSFQEHWLYQGGGTRIRQKISEGAALINYYGHGGGYQWDLTFVNDDIYTLENENRLPFILSVTCYTGHFDNQNVFGEQFIKVPGKGCVGFLGSSGLTYWNSGLSLNNFIFSSIFNQNNFVSGKFVLYAKNLASSFGTNAYQIALLTHLGDPVQKLALPDNPDFELIPDNLSISPRYPVVGDTVNIKLLINNWGTNFKQDSVNVQIRAELLDTSYTISSHYIQSFALKDSIVVNWVPNKGGVYTLTARINEENQIPEMDFSDNSTSNTYVVFNISDPSIIKPVDCFSTSDSTIEFLISDIGYYIEKDLTYFIEIDTSYNFNSPLLLSGPLNSEKSLVKWKPNNVNSGIYFWRTRIFDGIQYGRWSDTRAFSLNEKDIKGYFADKKVLKTFTKYNLEYNNITESLVLNTDSLPARPSNLTLLDDFYPDPVLPDSLHLTSLTTDGTYLYFGNIWATASSNEGKSKIYRIGTGNNGTVKGRFYGEFSEFRDSIKNSITYHPDNHLYISIGSYNKLARINTNTGRVDTVTLPVGLLRWDKTTEDNGPIYIASDGKYIYNLTSIDSLGNHKFTVRILNPSNGWNKVRPDLVLAGNSFQQNFSGFFVHGDRIYIGEYFRSNFMRRYRLDDGYFEEEWVVILPGSNFQSYYSWAVDKNNDAIYASVYRATGFVPKLSKFAGFYVDTQGFMISNQVGPVDKWNYLKFDILNNSSSGSYKTKLLGYNTTSKLWDTLQTNFPDSISINYINPITYKYLKLRIDLSDSTFNVVEPMQIKNIHFDYDELSDLYVEEDDIIFGSDSLIQGFPIYTTLRTKMIGDGSDSLKFEFIIDSITTIYNVKSNPDSISNSKNFNIETSRLLFDNEVQLKVSQEKQEYYYYNNLTKKSFYVSRDSIKPNFSITFDGNEIVDGDIISSEPEIIMTLEDNSPLPLSPNLFSIQHNNQTLNFYNSSDSLQFDYTPYPNSKATVTWRPKLEDGLHTLSVFVKDSSGNPFNTSQSVYKFYVFNNPDLLQVYNYPNPFKDKTDFTFEIRGIIPPEEMKIKVFTVAGRLIKELIIPGSMLQIGFNRIPWDGKDQDGDEIANGVYFYKIISKHGDETKVTTQKLAKLK